MRPPANLRRCVVVDDDGDDSRVDSGLALALDDDPDDASSSPAGGDEIAAAAPPGDVASGGDFVGVRRSDGSKMRVGVLTRGDSRGDFAPELLSLNFRGLKTRGRFAAGCVATELVGDEARLLAVELVDDVTGLLAAELVDDVTGLLAAELVNDVTGLLAAVEFMADVNEVTIVDASSAVSTAGTSVSKTC